MKRSLFSAFVALGLTLNAGVVTAAVVQIDNFVFTPAQPLTVPAPAFSGSAGQMTGTIDGGSFFTYSTEIGQSFVFGTPYSDYTVVEGVAAWGATRSLDIDRVLSAAIAAGVPANGAQSAAIQAAIWEVLYETPGNSYNLASGDFTATSSDASTQGFMNVINWAGILAFNPTNHFNLLRSVDRQDFLVDARVAAVPEPATLALIGLGLAGLAASRRRKQ